MSRSRAVKAVSLMWLASLLGAGAAFLLQVFIARKLGAESYGFFSSVLAVVTFLTPLAAFGLPQFWLKVFGQEGWSAIKWLRSSLHFFVISLAAIVVVIMLWAVSGNHSESEGNLYFILVAFLLGNAMLELVSSKLQLEERYYMLAFMSVLPGIARLLMLLLFFVFFSEVDYFYLSAFAYCIVGFCMFVFLLPEFLSIYRGGISLVGHGVKQEFVSEDPGIKKIFWGAMPFGLAGSFHLIYFQSSVVLLAYLSSGDEAGIYNVAFLVMSAVYLFPNIVYQKFLLPKIHRWSKQDPILFYRTFKMGSIAMLVVGFLASLAVWVIAPYLLPILFGQGFSDAVEVVCLLSLCAPIRFMATSVGSVLVTQEHMIYKVWCMAFVAVFSLFVNFLLIPELAIRGALLTTFLSECLLLILYYLISRKYVFYKKRVVCE